MRPAVATGEDSGGPGRKRIWDPRSLIHLASPSEQNHGYHVASGSRSACAHRARGRRRAGGWPNVDVDSESGEGAARARGSVSRCRLSAWAQRTHFGRPSSSPKGTGRGRTPSCRTILPRSRPGCTASCISLRATRRMPATGTGRQRERFLALTTCAKRSRRRALPLIHLATEREGGGA